MRGNEERWDRFLCWNDSIVRIYCFWIALNGERIWKHFSNILMAPCKKKLVFGSCTWTMHLNSFSFSCCCCCCRHRMLIMWLEFKECYEKFIKHLYVYRCFVSFSNMPILWFTLIHVFILYILKVWMPYLMSKYIRFQINDII